MYVPLRAEQSKVYSLTLASWGSPCYCHLLQEVVSEAWEMHWFVWICVKVIRSCFVTVNHLAEWEFSPKVCDLGLLTTLTVPSIGSISWSRTWIQSENGWLLPNICDAIGPRTCHAWQVITVTHSIHIWVRMFWCIALFSRAETSGSVPTWFFNALWFKLVVSSAIGFHCQFLEGNQEHWW